MHGLYELKEMLCKELEEYGNRQDLSAGSLDVIDKLAHAVKNINKIIEFCDEDPDSSYSNRRTNRPSMYSERRARDNGYYYRNDAPSGRRVLREMGGYSKDDEMLKKLKYMMDDTQDERTRQELQNIIYKMEEM